MGKGGGKNSGDLTSLIASLLGGKGGGWKMSAFKKTMSVVNKTDSSKKAFLSGIADGTTYKDVMKHFEENGHKAKLVEVFKNGAGVCTFSNSMEASAAIDSMNGTICNGAAIVVDTWEEKPKDDSKPKVGKKPWGKGKGK